ncbi:ParA family protein [Sporomusa sp. KB1]|jgi:chromosome partitioning protein|uniref:ParA family protein n=1 Tax=Sporomusa sp. KB1 TaxID=943346 RepID=UPI0011A32372|nr:ParA family protein [Sporomusa sp. KB1]TWH49613.1 chromosome partitioning protein [Sporomusa sp. KB1]
MKIISIINLKGGVAKTITTINIGHILATKCGQRVLFIDNDKQGNTSKFLGLHNDNDPSLADLLTETVTASTAIRKTEYPGLDIIPANMHLLKANLKIMLDETREQQTILKNALQQVASEYDYCIIDNAPDINMSVINGLVAADEVIIPLKIDQFGFDGLKEIAEQIDQIKEFNPGINFRGCLITQYANNDVNSQGEAHLREQTKYPIFKTHIRRTDKVDESTFARRPIIEYSPRCNAAKDYLSFVKEYLGE